MNIILFIIGFISGLTMGLIGIGAGAVLIPLLILYGFEIKQSIAISLALQSIPIALIGFNQFYINGHFLIKPALIIILTSSFGIYIGSKLSNHFKSYLLKQLLGFFLIITGFYFIKN